jgi:predicted MFS family arabinose efflux permease
LFLLSVFGPLYLTQVAGQAPTTAGFVLGAFGLGAFFGGFIRSGITNRIGRKTMLSINAVTTGLIPLLLWYRCFMKICCYWCYCCSFLTATNRSRR